MYVLLYVSYLDIAKCVLSYQALLFVAMLAEELRGVSCVWYIYFLVRTSVQCALLLSFREPARGCYSLV